MNLAFCSLPAAPVRKEPSHRTEMVNQLVFGEAVTVLSQDKDWLWIRSSFDNYEGWVTENLLTIIKDIPPAIYTTCDLVNRILVDDTVMNVPMGSFLPGYDGKSQLPFMDKYRYSGACQSTGKLMDLASLLNLSKQWLYAPYLWGGKTFLGVDCSGFIQTIFKVNGIPLKRDAWQQEQQGKVIGSLEESQPGDVAFFKNEDGRVVHVGLLLENSTIIHAAGYVRIDPLTSAGIVHAVSGKQTHVLHSIKRMG